MTSKEIQVITDFVNHIQSHGGNFTEWCVGVASDVRPLLLNRSNGHKAAYWIYQNVDSEQAATDIEKFLIGRYNVRQGSPTGKQPIRYVYAYKIG